MLPNLTKRRNLYLLVVMLICQTTNANNNYGKETDNLNSNLFKALKQSKRDLSLSYAATNIDSKEGTRVKTITVIKNIGNKKHEKIAVNPELHKNENWAKHFRDNFDSYGIIPDVPDIDDLFEFMNKKKDTPNVKEAAHKKEILEREHEKPVKEVQEDILDNDDVEVVSNQTQKIEGDAEILPSMSKKFKSTGNQHRLESLPAGSNTKQRLIDVNYSTPQHSVHQYFENYIQLPVEKNIVGYDYPKPCQQNPPNSISIATPGGRTFNIPANYNRNNTFPYLAPVVTRKPTVAPTQQQVPLPPAQIFPATISVQFPPQVALVANLSNNNNNNFNRPPFSVNSLVGPIDQQTQQQQQPQQPQNNLQPPLQTTLSSTAASVTNNQGNNLNQTPFQLGNVQQTASSSTSQRPYVAPNIRPGLTINRPYALGLSRRPNTFRPVSIHQFGPHRAVFTRSRGLKY